MTLQATGRRRWAEASLAVWIVVACLGAAAAEAEVETMDPATDPDLWLPDLELPPPVRFWDKTITLRALGGYRDNVLFSHFTRQESPLVGGSVEGSFYRLPLDGTQALIYLFGEHHRFLSAPSLDSESTALALAQVKREVGRNWKVGLSLQYLFQDQVLDVSTLATEVAVLPIEGHRFSGRPMVRWDFWRPYWLELEGGATRQYLRQPLDDFWEAGPRVTLGRDLGKHSELSLSYEFLRRWHDRRTQVSREGFRLEGTSLEFDLHRVELAWQQTWDAQRRWRTTTKLGSDANADNGPGFFDYQRFQFSQVVRYRTDTWELRGQVRGLYYDYGVQTVSPEDASARTRLALRFNARAERKLGKAVRIFAEYEHERSMSDFVFDDYKVNTVLAGLDMEF